MRTKRRMRRNRLSTVYLKRRGSTKDAECVTTPVYGAAIPMTAEIWPASGELQTLRYGDRINSIMNLRVEGDYSVSDAGTHVEYVFEDFSLCEGDGICVYAEQEEGPDYRIKSIMPYRPLKMEVERI